MAKQTDLIFMHIKKYGSITAKEAENEYGCMRLASRINDLRRDGVAIVSEIVTGKGRHGGKTHYARYRLAEGSEGSAAGGGRSDLSEWQRSASNEPALAGEDTAGLPQQEANI